MWQSDRSCGRTELSTHAHTCCLVYAVVFTLLIARYVLNVAKRSIWDQCKKKYILRTDRRPMTDRPTTSHLGNFKWPYLREVSPNPRWPPSWKIQIAISLRRIIRFTPCLVLDDNPDKAANTLTIIQYSRPMRSLSFGHMHKKQDRRASFLYKLTCTKSLTVCHKHYSIYLHAPSFHGSVHQWYPGSQLKHVIWPNVQVRCICNHKLVSLSFLTSIQSADFSTLTAGKAAFPRRTSGIWWRWPDFFRGIFRGPLAVMGN